MLLNENILIGTQWISDQTISGKIFPVHVDCTDSGVVISFVIINTFCCIATAGIVGYFEFIIDQYTSTGVRNSIKDVEKLADAVRFSVITTGI